MSARHTLRVFRVSLFTITVSLLCSTAAEAQTIIDWTAGGATDYYLNTANWTGGDVPNDTTESARFNLAGSYDVTFKFTSNTTVSDLLVNAGDINFATDVAGPAIYNTADDVIIDGGDLTLSQTGGADDMTLNVGDQLQIQGDSQLLVELGSNVTSNTLVLGTSASGDGTAIFDGGGSTLAVSGSVSMGVSGSIGTLTFRNGSTGNSIGGTIQLIAGSGVVGSTGRLNVLSGAALETANIVVGNSGSPTLVQEATLTVDGLNSDLTMTGASTLTIGDDINPNITADAIVGVGGTLTTGTGAVTIRNSGRLEVQSTGTFNANGNVTVDGATIDRLAVDANFNLGAGLSLTASNDAQLNFTGDFTIDNGGAWTLQSGADYNTTSSFDDIRVGVVTDGSLIVENAGASLNLGTSISSSATSYIGSNGATGAITIRDSATATFGKVYIASSTVAGTSGELNIEDGATVTAGDSFLAVSATSNPVPGEINIGGATGTATLTLTGASTLSVGATAGNTTATINLTLNGQLNTGTGLTTVNNTGLIDINGGYLDVNGDLVINGGEVRRQSGTLVLEPASSVTLQNGGILELTGTLNISQDIVVTVNSGSYFSTTSYLDIGNGSDGALIVDGAGSSVLVNGASYWGASGATAQVTFRNEATGQLSFGDIVRTGASTAIFLVESGADLTFTSTTDINDQGVAGSEGVLTVTGAGSTVTMNSSTTMRIGQETNGTATLNVLNGGTFTKNNGTIEIRPTGLVNLDGGAMVINQILDQGGAFNYLGGSLSMNSDFVVGPSGLFKSSSLTLGSNDAITTTGAATIDPASTLILDGGVFTSDTLVKNGSIQFLSGTLAITGAGGSSIGAAGPFGSYVIFSAGQNFAVTNTLSVDAGSILVVETGASVSAGSLAVDGEVVLDGAAAVLGGSSVSNGGLVRGNGTITANMTNNASGEVRASFGDTLTMTGTNGDNLGKLNLQGGALLYSNTLINDTGGKILGRGMLDVGGTGLINQGDVTLSSGVSDVFGDVLNDSTGRVIVSGNADVTFWDEVTNSGTLFRVSSGSSATFPGTESPAPATNTLRPACRLASARRPSPSAETLSSASPPN